MARAKWTLVLVSDDARDVRQLRLSRQSVRLTIGLVLLGVALLSSLVTAGFLGTERARADARLVATNRQLEAELDRINTRVDTLQQSLEGLYQQDEHYRLLAGLEPLDTDVKQVGIGGPDGTSLEQNALWQVDRQLGRKSFNTAAHLNALIRRARLLSFSWREAGDTLRYKHERLAAMPSILPTAGYVSSTFTMQRWHPILDRPRPHTGIDITAPRGTPIVAAAHGRVQTVSTQGEYGLTVEIDHGFGTITRYAHMSRASVKVGQPIRRGDIIGNVGSSGLAVGPHLHYEVLVNGQPANPRRYIFNTRVVPD